MFGVVIDEDLKWQERVWRKCFAGLAKLSRICVMRSYFHVLSIAQQHGTIDYSSVKK